MWLHRGSYMNERVTADAKNTGNAPRKQLVADSPIPSNSFLPKQIQFSNSLIRDMKKSRQLSRRAVSSVSVRVHPLLLAANSNGLFIATEQHGQSRYIATEQHGKSRNCHHDILQRSSTDNHGNISKIYCSGTARTITEQQSVARTFF